MKASTTRLSELPAHLCPTRSRAVYNLWHMDLKAIVQTIDEEIERLSKARALLTDHSAPLKRGLPHAAPARKRGTMSAEGRARVAAAQRKRWAKAKGK